MFNIKAWAVSGAVLMGIYLCLAALMAMGNVQFMWFSKEVFALLTTMYPGLEASLVGAFFGLIDGAICGAICAGIFAGIHNFTLKRLQ